MRFVFSTTHVLRVTICYLWNQYTVATISFYHGFGITSFKMSSVKGWVFVCTKRNGKKKSYSIRIMLLYMWKLIFLNVEFYLYKTEFTKCLTIITQIFLPRCTIYILQDWFFCIAPWNHLKLHILSLSHTFCTNITFSNS